MVRIKVMALGVVIIAVGIAVNYGFGYGLIPVGIVLALLGATYLVLVRQNQGK